MIKKSVKSTLKCDTLLCKLSINFEITPSMTMRIVREYLKGNRAGIMFSRKGRDGDIPFYSFTEASVFVGEISILGCCSEKIGSYTLRGLIEKINREDIWVGVGAELFHLEEVNIISPKKSGHGPAGMMIIYVFANGKVFHRHNYSYLLNMELEDSQGEWSACSRSFLPSIYKGLIDG